MSGFRLGKDPWNLPLGWAEAKGALWAFNSCSSGRFREVWVEPHLRHQGLLMGALDHGQDSIQFLSGHVV